MSAFNQRNSDSMSLTEMLLKELDGDHEPSTSDNKFREDIIKQPTSANVKLNFMDSEILEGVNIEKNDDSFGDLVEGYARDNAPNAEMQRPRAVPCPVPPPPLPLPMQMAPSNMNPYVPYPPMNYPPQIINTNSYGAPLPVPPPNFHYSNQQYNPVPDYKKVLTMSVSALPDTTLAIQLKNKKKKKTKKSGEKSGEITNPWNDSPALPSPVEPIAEESPPSPTPGISAAKSHSLKHVKEDKLVFKKQTTKLKSPTKINRIHTEHSSEVNNIRKKQDNDIITSTRLDENESLSDLFTKLKTLNDELALLSEKPSADDSDNEGKEIEDIPFKPKLHSDVFISPKKTNLDTRIKMMISSSDSQNNISISNEDTPMSRKTAKPINKQPTTLEQENKIRSTLEQRLKISRGVHQKLSFDKKNNSHITWKKEEQLHKKSIIAPTPSTPVVIPPPTPAALLKPPDMRRDVKTVLLDQKQAIRSDRRPWLDPIIPSEKTANKIAEQEPSLLRPLDKIPSPFLSKELYLYWHKESVKFIKYRERTMMKYINPQMRYIFKDNIVKELNSYASKDSKIMTENKEEEEDVDKYLERLNEINKKLQELDGCSPKEQNDSSDDNDESSGSSDESDDNAESIHNSSDDKGSDSSDNDSSKSNKSGDSSDNDSSSDSSNDEADTSTDGTNKEKLMDDQSIIEQAKKILKDNESMKLTSESDDISDMDVVESSKSDKTELDSLTTKEESMEMDTPKESSVTKVRSMSVGEELEISDAKTSESRGIKRSREEVYKSKSESLVQQVLDCVLLELKESMREHIEGRFIDRHVEEFESSRKRIKLDA